MSDIHESSERRLGLGMGEDDKRIQELERLLEEERARNAKLVARNARLSYDLDCSYQYICKLKGDHY